MKKTLSLLLLLAGLTLEARAETLTWNGSEGHMVWNIEDSNWLSGETAATYTDSSTVVFGGAGYGTVSLADTFAPASVEVNANKDYSFSGNGKLTGSMQLIKDGEGSLTINTANDYTGGTRIKSGTLVMGNDAALGGGVVTLVGGTLDLNNAISSSLNVSVEGAGASIDNGTFNGNITVGAGKMFSLGPQLKDCTGAVAMGESSTLRLSSKTISSDVTLLGSYVILLNGTISGSLILQDDVSFTWLNNALQLAGGISLGNNATFNLAGQRVDAGKISIAGDSATIGNGTITGDLAVAQGKCINLMANTEMGGSITLKDGAALNLGSNSFAGAVSLGGDVATIGNGTLCASVIVDEGTLAHFSGETYISGSGAITVTGDPTSIKALGNASPGLIKELSVSQGLIAGTGPATSLADGVDISRMGGNLTLENLVLTENNSISVGDGHTITLNNVTIKLSQTDYKLVEGVYYFNLSDLFHCSVDMTDVTFDASDLSLPQGFNPETNGIAFNLGDAELEGAFATRDITLLLGGYGSQTMDIDEQGRPVFSSLVPIPEPATGTLGLLALAALAARRKR